MESLTTPSVPSKHGRRQPARRSGPKDPVTRPHHPPLPLALFSSSGTHLGRDREGHPPGLCLALTVSATLLSHCFSIGLIRDKKNILCYKKGNLLLESQKLDPKKTFFFLQRY